MSKDIDKIRTAINTLMHANKILIFSKTYCPFSDFVKEAFDALREEYKVVELDTMKDGHHWQNALTTITGCRTIPQVFLNGQYLGGSQEIEALLKSGDLQKMVKLKDLLPLIIPLIAGPGRGLPREPSREPSKHPPREPSREPSKQPHREPSKELHKKPHNEKIRKLSTEPPAASPRVSTKEPPRESHRKRRSEPPRKPSKEMEPPREHHKPRRSRK